MHDIGMRVFTVYKIDILIKFRLFFFLLISTLNTNNYWENLE